MNTRLVNSAAGVILAALTQNRTATGIALALESAQMLMTPETAAELETLRGRVAELEAERHSTNAALVDVTLAQRTAEDRPADEYPIRYALTEAAEDLRSCCAGPVCTCTASSPQDDEGEVSPRRERLRDLLAVQRAMVLVEDSHDSPLHHPYRLGRDFPQAGGAS